MMDFGEPWLIGGNQPQSDAYDPDIDRLTTTPASQTRRHP